MKVFYIVMAIIMTVLILVLAFENITASCSGMYFFFSSLDQSPTILTFGLAVLGVITGVFYHALFVQIFYPSDKDEDAEF